MNISVIGAGGWGTALAGLLSENGHNVILWAFEKEVVEEINSFHTNTVFLPGINLHKEVRATNNPDEICSASMIVNAVPTQYIRSILNGRKFNLKNKTIVNVAKGIEKGSLLRVSEIFQQSAGITSDCYTVLTGPSHAEEVAKKSPTTVVAASENYAEAHLVQKVFSNQYFRVYTSDDVTGCEIGGSLKNVIAIAAGIIDGLELGDNTKAALITRGLAEISRLGIALGANPLTFSGMSGLGDLIVTCNSQHSRNRYVGEQIGRGKTLAEITGHMAMVAEGVSTTESAFHLGEQHKVELPIVEQVHRILFEDVRPLEAIKELMTRKYKREWWW